MKQEYWKKLEAAFEQAVGGDVTDSHPLDILHQVLDALEGRVLSFKSGQGPERLVVRIAARDESQGAVYRRTFVEEPYLQDAARQTLEELGWPPDRQPEVAAEVAVEPGLLAGGRRFVIEEVWPAPEKTAAALKGQACLTVEQGAADGSPLVIARPRTMIGRQADVYNQLGQPIRHNDLAFREDDDVSLTVSRSHAHIEFDARRKQYRLFHDEGSSTTGVVRDGRLLDITRNPRGLALMHGDVIYLGKARVRFEMVDK